MLRFLRYFLVVVILCGCATDHKSNTFKEKYNVYAEPEIDEGSAELPFPDSSPDDDTTQSLCGVNPPFASCFAVRTDS